MSESLYWVVDEFNVCFGPWDSMDRAVNEGVRLEADGKISPAWAVYDNPEGE